MGRYRFILWRPLQLVPVLLGVSLISFLLVHAIPGDPVRILLGTRATAAVIEATRAQYGLDQPLALQYLYFLKNLAAGEFGKSIIFKIGIPKLVVSRIVPTLFLLGYAIFMSVVIAIGFAVLAAVYRGRWPDQVVRVYSTAGLGLPAFWLGIVLIILFSIELGLFPVSGYGETPLDHLHHLFLPALTIALALSPVLIRNLRASLLAEMEADYVKAARSRGLSEAKIFRRHIFRNSLIPTITLLGVNVGWLIGGTVVVEQVFSVPGLGSLMVSSIFARDYLVVQVVTLAFALAVILTNFIVDIVTVALDPRVKL
ncbi:ABC transporter permease [Hypericibacter terrae]|uniref:ABC transporter permease n=1 Tax=Hypericibacter terrae TaxID=2602015 RepID=A0A5J6MSD3_9PROT|nr:ABC transporter permease [Hypericibacter terrae]QEX17796.1 ABC transporter permease [Hypericibacter terrae]